MSFHFKLYLNTGVTLDTESFADIEDLYRAYVGLISDEIEGSSSFVQINYRSNPYEWASGSDAPKFHYLNRNVVAAVTIVETKPPKPSEPPFHIGEKVLIADRRPISAAEEEEGKQGEIEEWSEGTIVAAECESHPYSDRTRMLYLVAPADDPEIHLRRTEEDIKRV